MAAHAGWEAELQLSFARDGAARTALRERRHSGPLRVQRPFYPEGPEVCHVYLLHPPGGLVAGDQLQIGVQVEPGAHALVTTPAAAKLYRTAHLDRRAQQTAALSVGPDAVLEWLPQETIAFAGARADLTTRVQLSASARFLGWEILCLGRPASGEQFHAGEVRPSVEIRRGERLEYLERGRYAAGDALLQAAWGLSGQPVVGTLLCAAPGAAGLVEPARAAVSGAEVGRAAVSGWSDLLVARYVGPSAEQARQLFTAIWATIRPLVLSKEASPPRIWHT